MNPVPDKTALLCLVVRSFTPVEHVAAVTDPEHHEHDEHEHLHTTATSWTEATQLTSSTNLSTKALVTRLEAWKDMLRPCRCSHSYNSPSLSGVGLSLIHI